MVLFSHIANLSRDTKQRRQMGKPTALRNGTLLSLPEELVLRNGFFLTYLFCVCALIHMCSGMYKSQKKEQEPAWWHIPLTEHLGRQSRQKPICLRPVWATQEFQASQGYLVNLAQQNKTKQKQRQYHQQQQKKHPSNSSSSSSLKYA